MKQEEEARTYPCIEHCVSQLRSRLHLKALQQECQVGMWVLEKSHLLEGGVDRGKWEAGRLVEASSAPK